MASSGKDGDNQGKQQDEKGQREHPPMQFRGIFLWLIILTVILLVFQYWDQRRAKKAEVSFYPDFVTMVEQGEIELCDVVSDVSGRVYVRYELKKKEDKQLLVESQLTESKVHHALLNVPKAKASLTAVKTTAHAIYVVPLLQAEIDMMSGLIAADEKDYLTAYSYLYETFEGYRSMNHPGAGNAFKLMLFSKIMNK